ncbi:glucosidase II beta subunit-like-domain-containing protein [Lipomyces japonicus]|uniref:glucosidase II beta subunit-like-domain-containing protein n=1 Tax=Lipomyces japonicus TaxID=56871 RepID=UPI0034CEFA39
MRLSACAIALVLSTLASQVCCARSVVIRGISKEDEALYQPDANGNWACLGHPEIVLSLSKINDDFCDCPDGSDEPGTSACPKGKFYCLNKGHIPGVLPASRVNDGVCDYDICCNGSDEWAGIVKCENKCKEIAVEYNKKQAELKRIQVAGWNARSKLVTKAALQRASLEKDIRQIDAQLESANARVTKATETLKLAEVNASSRVSKKGSPVLERAKQRIKEYQDGVQILEKHISKLEARLNTAEDILTRLKDEYNPNYNDEGVKSAVKAFNEYRSNLASEEDIEEYFKLLDGKDDEEFFAEEAIDVDPDVVEYDSYLPLEWRIWIHDTKTQLREFLITHGLLADRSTHGETAGVSQAKKDLDHATKIASDLEIRQGNVLQQLNTNYGPDDVFRALSDECISSESGEYTYVLCFNDKTEQKSSKGGITSLGGFDRLQDDKLYFLKGTKCWNGPHRSTVVEMQCGDKNEILTVSEPAMCEYLFKIITPALCVSPEDSKQPAKDEL